MVVEEAVASPCKVGHPLAVRVLEHDAPERLRHVRLDLPVLAALRYNKGTCSMTPDERFVGTYSLGHSSSQRTDKESLRRSESEREGGQERGHLRRQLRRGQVTQANGVWGEACTPVALDDQPEGRVLARPKADEKRLALLP